MSPWLPRAFWLAAWSCWLWLGFGLYRELPRVSTVVSQLPCDRTNGLACGFVGDTNSIAVANQPLTGESSIEVYDAETARLERRIPLSRSFDLYDVNRSLALRFGAFIGYGNLRTSEGVRPGLYLLNLANAEWKRIGVNISYDPSVHPDHPWVVFVETRPIKPPFTAPIPEVVVHDIVADKRIFVRQATKETVIAERPFFIPKSRTVVVPVRKKSPPRTLDDVDFEIWKLAAEPRLERTVEGLAVGDRTAVSATGRIAFIGFGEGDGQAEAFVFDLQSGRLIFSKSQPRVRPVGVTGSAGHIAWVRLSSDGRRMIHGPRGPVWNIDAFSTTWERRPFEFCHPADDGEHFVVREQWGRLWNERATKSSYNTQALRRLDSGALVVRAPVDHFTFPSSWNTARTLGVSFDGVVHRLPLSVNWLLFVLCQSILALPLILLWALQRWRRNRRMRLAEVRQ